MHICSDCGHSVRRKAAVRCHDCNLSAPDPAVWQIRSSGQWTKLAKQTIAEEPVCWLQLPGCTGRSTTADHVVPVRVRPDLAYVRSNTRGACRGCNCRRKDTPVDELDTLRASMVVVRPRRRRDEDVKTRLCAVCQTPYVGNGYQRTCGGFECGKNWYLIIRGEKPLPPHNKPVLSREARIHFEHEEGLRKARARSRSRANAKAT